MKEVLLQYIWQYKMFCPSHLATTDGAPIEIIDYGRKNNNAGPDFFNAKVKIGDTIWAGNVEIHIQSSDWLRHKHDKDSRYENVILHVVNEHDKTIHRQDGRAIPTLVIQPNEELLKRYEEMMSGAPFVTCAQYWGQLPDGFLRLYASQLLTERLYRKSTEIKAKVDQLNGDWEETLYVTLATAFGQGTNAYPFERLALSLPLKLIAKQHDNPTQIEAMLFGQAGLLNENPNDEHERTLLQEYEFLKNKFGLKPIDKSLWVYAKMRPANFPHIKIAQLAQLLFRQQNLFSAILSAKGINELKTLFEVETSPYWEKHYSFGSASTQRKKKLGDSSIDLLVINLVAPLLFAYAQKRELPHLAERATEILEQTKPEKNSIISQWETLGIVCKNAYDTQAMLELKKRYCNEKNCLRCTIAHQVLQKSIRN